MSELIRKPGVTVVDGVEHPDAVWRCACGKGISYAAFTLPPGWCEMEIAIGGPPPHGIPQRQKRIFCPTCARSVLAGGGIQPPARLVLTLPSRVALPANVPWNPPWRK
jgi:hypothetical protein